MMSAEDMAIARIAISICNNTELKREFLCAAGLKYDPRQISRHALVNMWHDRVEKKTAIIGCLGLSRQLNEKVADAVLLIGTVMLNWAVYHEDVVGFSRECSIDALSVSLFTQQGLIDNQKAAIELMKNRNLSIKQRYKLACLYCFVDDIPVLYGQMTELEKQEFYDIKREQIFKQPQLVKFWSSYLHGDLDEVKGGNDFDQSMLEQAVESGSKAAVAYCLEKENSGITEDGIVDAAIETVRNRILCIQAECFAFREDGYDDYYLWIPRYHFVDILCYLLSKMGDVQQIDFFLKDIEGVCYLNTYRCGDPFIFPQEFYMHSKVLEYFLDWPYQIYFMRIANLMWEILPEESYFDLLMQICKHIYKKTKKNCQIVGYYDYRKLFREFWCSSPEHYKRYIFSNKGITCNRVGKLLYKLFKIRPPNFTDADRKNILMILSDASNEEKINIISSHEGEEICMKLLKETRWNMLDQVILNCISCTEQANKFKRKLSFMNDAKIIFIDFVKDDEKDAVASFIKWSSLKEVEINDLKRQIIFSDDFQRVCLNLIVHFNNNNTIEPLNKFIKWWILLEESIIEFKKELIFSELGIYTCSYLLREGNVELVDLFVNWSLSSEEDITELKKQTISSLGSSISLCLTSNFKIRDEEGDTIDGSGRCKWEEVEKCLTWCFSCEREINDFKRSVLYAEWAKDILYKLVRFNLWDEAETFLAWLGLTPEEQKQLKKETLFDHDDTFTMFRTMVCTKYWDTNETYMNIFPSYGSKPEAIELFLRWFLSDKEAVLEFKTRFKNLDYQDFTKHTKARLNDFNLAVDQRIADLNSEQRGRKRKSKNVTQIKKIKNFAV